MLAAFLEIVFGFVYTPVPFLRAVLVGKLTPYERRLIARGYAACLCFWAVVIAVVSHFGWWMLLFVGLVVPMMLAGMLQTLNKFEQHLGLHGQTVLGLTRTVVDKHRLSEMLSAAMLYSDYHGPHHRNAKILYHHLPHATPCALASAREYCPVFPNIIRATVDMLCCLANPKVGPQWIEHKEERRSRVVADAPTALTPQPVFTGSYQD